MHLSFNKIQEVIFCCSIGLVLLSCQKEIDYDLPQSEPKFILDAYVFPTPASRPLPSARFGLYVGRSTSVFSEIGPELINMANLRLYENDIEIDSAIRNDGLVMGGPAPFFFPNCYVVHRFEPGNQYRIEASNPELGLAWSEFRMPDSIPLLSAEWDTLSRKVNFTFKDPPGPNYYYFRIESSDDSTRSNLSTCFQTTDPAISIFRKDEFDSLLIYSPYSLGIFGCSGFFTDQNFDGKLKTIEVKLQEAYIGKLAEVKPVLYNITRDMYEHERTLSAYTETRDNPFAEKVKIHNNIQNGFGIFAGATPATIVATKK